MFLIVVVLSCLVKFGLLSTVRLACVCQSMRWSQTVCEVLGSILLLDHPMLAGIRFIVGNDRRQKTKPYVICNEEKSLLLTDF